MDTDNSVKCQGPSFSYDEFLEVLSFGRDKPIKADTLMANFINSADTNKDGCLHFNEYVGIINDLQNRMTTETADTYLNCKPFYIGEALTRVNAEWNDLSNINRFIYASFKAVEAARREKWALPESGEDNIASSKEKLIALLTSAHEHGAGRTGVIVDYANNSILEVSPCSSAEEAGLKVGDVLLSVNDVSAERYVSLQLTGSCDKMAKVKLFRSDPFDIGIKELLIPRAPLAIAIKK